MEREARKLDPVAREKEREMDRLRKQRDRVDSALNMRVIQSLREVLGLGPL